MAEPLRTSQLATAEPPPKKAKPGISRARRVEELGKGNANALRHGVFAVVANQQDVAVEVALTYAARPLLDPIVDRRLVELLATTNVQRNRCLIAMAEAGLSQQLTAYDSRLAALVERLERAVHDREKERATVARQQPANLEVYRRDG
jgi:hypothetical protein